MEDLVRDNLWMVRAIARSRMRRIWYEIEYNELVSFGTIGLIDAAKKFDLKRGLKFSTYAYTRINGAITDGLRGKHYRCSRQEAVPLEDEDMEKLVASQRLDTDIVAEDEYIAEKVRDAVRRLPEREKYVITRHDLEGATQEEIAKEMKLSASMVSVIRSKGIKMLSGWLKSMKDFVALER